MSPRSRQAASDVVSMPEIPTCLIWQVLAELKTAPYEGSGIAPSAIPTAGAAEGGIDIIQSVLSQPVPRGLASLYRPRISQVRWLSLSASLRIGNVSTAFCARRPHMRRCGSRDRLTHDLPTRCHSHDRLTHDLLTRSRHPRVTGIRAQRPACRHHHRRIRPARRSEALYGPREGPRAREYVLCWRSAAAGTPR